MKQLNIMLRKQFRINRIRRIAFKEKLKEEEKIRKTGSNYPVNTEKNNNIQKKEDKKFPFLL
tara:strand:+ start:109 stop:294 length:186 start_codon:yes stop_codon:yes gene_type:complete